VSTRIHHFVFQLQLLFVLIKVKYFS